MLTILTDTIDALFEPFLLLVPIIVIGLIVFGIYKYLRDKNPNK